MRPALCELQARSRISEHFASACERSGDVRDNHYQYDSILRSRSIVRGSLPMLQGSGSGAPPLKPSVIFGALDRGQSPPNLAFSLKSKSSAFIAVSGIIPRGTFSPP